jgi:hypothetical protein
VRFKLDHIVYHRGSNMDLAVWHVETVSEE